MLQVECFTRMPLPRSSRNKCGCCDGCAIVLGANFTSKANSFWHSPFALSAFRPHSFQVPSLWPTACLHKFVLSCVLTLSTIITTLALPSLLYPSRPSCFLNFFVAWSAICFLTFAAYAGLALAPLLVHDVVLCMLLLPPPSSLMCLVVIVQYSESSLVLTPMLRLLSTVCALRSSYHPLPNPPRTRLCHLTFCKIATYTECA